MKKIISIFLALTLCAAVCGCAGQTEESSAPDPRSAAEEIFKAEQSREAEESKAAEASRKAEESKAAEASRKAEESKAAEASRKAEESKAAEASRKAEESKAAEASRKAEESKAAEASRKAEESRAAEESRRAEESRAAEEQHRAEETKAAEESNKTQESSKQQQSQPAKQKTTPKPTSGTKADTSWFDDAVFVGDSVTLKLSYYADSGALGSAEFLCAGSLGYNNALWDIDHPDNVHPMYRGSKVTVDEGLRQIGRSKILIMLGMNDIGLYGVDGAIDGMKKLTARIEAKCPNAQIYIESVTPMLEECQLRDLNNTTIRQFDEKVEKVCEQKGYIYLDIASAVDDGYGNLVYSYCGDPGAMGLHFSDAGCAAWVERLKETVL